MPGAPQRASLLRGLKCSPAINEQEAAVNEQESTFEFGFSRPFGRSTIRSFSCATWSAMRRFYEDILGFPLLRELSPGWVEYRVGDNTLALARPSLTAADASNAQRQRLASAGVQGFRS